MKIAMLLLIAFLACSETAEEPIPAELPMPTITIAKDGWNRGAKTYYYDHPAAHVFRTASLTLESDIPMPADTYILLHDHALSRGSINPYRLVRICEGHTRSAPVVYWRVCQGYGPFSTLEPEIRPMEERAEHLPYYSFQDGIELPVNYRFNPYKVGDPASKHLGTWCP